MRVLITAVMAGLLVAGCVQASKDPSQIEMKKMNESLRLVLNNICSLACGEFAHRNITPEELYLYLQKHLEHYKMVSDEMMSYCKVNKIEPCHIAFEKDPESLLNLLNEFKKDHPVTAMEIGTSRGL